MESGIKWKRNRSFFNEILTQFSFFSTLKIRGKFVKCDNLMLQKIWKVTGNLR